MDRFLMAVATAVGTLAGRAAWRFDHLAKSSNVLPSQPRQPVHRSARASAILRRTAC
jgi:hypothetical protein